MKKIVFILITGMALMMACKKDPLDITPDGRLTMADVWKDETRTEAYLNNVYLSIPQYFNTYGYFEFNSGTTDESRYRDGMNRTWGSGALDPTNNFLNNFYGTFWRGIREANIFLANVPTANVPNPNNRSRFMAEARILRAFYYFELIKQYGPMPVIDKELDINFDFVSLKRPTFQDNIDFIVNDLNEALKSPYLPVRLTIPNERGRVTKAMAYAIRSQALLYNASPLWNPQNIPAKWVAAAEASRDAINVLTANDEYKLADDYEDYFHNQSDISNSPRDRETIYETGRGHYGNLIVTNNLPSKDGGDREGATPVQELVDSYDMKATGEPAILGYSDPEHLQPIINTASGYDEKKPYEGRDPRFYASVWHNGASYDNIKGVIHTVETFVGGKDQLVRNEIKGFTTTGYYLRKFIDPKLQITQNTNAAWKKYRLAEIYLNYAEAENEAGTRTNEIYQYINKVRNRAGMPDLRLGLNKQELRDRIRRERRVELFMEEHRFWDVRRWKILEETGKLVTGMEITKGDNNSFNYKRFVIEKRYAWQPKFLIYPIPVGDASIIADFSAQQNPGW